MTLWLRDLMDRFDQLSLRERVIVLIAALLLIALIWDSVFMSPLDKQRKSRLQQVEALRAEVGGLEQNTEALVAQTAADPEKGNREALGKLKAEITDLDQRLAGATSGLIAPKDMPKVLEQVLSHASRLKLLSLRSLPPQAVTVESGGGTTPAAAGAAPGTPGTSQVYKHGIELELSGSYLDTLYFLQALETLPWKFFWDRIEFTVEQHPQGRIKLQVFTLGLEEGWLGV